MRYRLIRREELLSKIETKIAEITATINKGEQNRTPELDFPIPISCGNQLCDMKEDEKCDADIICVEKKRLACYECAKGSTKEFLQYTRRSVFDRYTIKSPFFGIEFDSNDITLFGGFTLVIVLIMLRLGLRNYILSLRICIKSVQQTTDAKPFYDLVASRQLFVFPYLEDKNQKPHFGQTEEIWKDSRLRERVVFMLRIMNISKQELKDILWKYMNTVFTLRTGDKNKNLSIFFTVLVTLILLAAFVSCFIFGILAVAGALILLFFFYVILKAFLFRREDIEHSSTVTQVTKNYWTVNPQPWLNRIPKIFSLIPFLVYFTSFIEDVNSSHIGWVLLPMRTSVSLCLSSVFLFSIFGLGFWCVSKWSEIDKLWEIFFNEAHHENRSRGKRRRLLT
jgi:hypothetical protein